MTAKKSSLNERMVPGVKVRLSGQFLRSTGQYTSSEARKVWTVQECPCRSCKAKDGFTTVAVNETKDKDDLRYFSTEELETMPYLKMRHIARCNLTIVGELSVRDA